MPAPSTRVALVVAGAGVAVAAIVALTTSGGGSDRDGDVTIAQAEVEGIHVGLCAALGHARSGDSTTANGAFYRVHTGIHQLIAATLSSGEDDAAARTNDQLLTVEDSLATRAPTLAEDLELLVTDVAEAADATGNEIPQRCAA